jgi:predicted esterase
MIVRTIASRAHGRYLVEPASAARPAPMLVGFHGYGEAADVELDRLRAIAPTGEWLIVSVQSMHRFYRARSQDVVAGWMTSQDRELVIADNIAYAGQVIDAVAGEWGAASTLVFSGFSQGVAMAFRAAAASDRPVSGAIVAGGDVPPEIDGPALSRVPRVLIARGARDRWYTKEKFDADQARLRAASVAITPVEFDGGHEWSEPVIARASDFLKALR